MRDAGERNCFWHVNFDLGSDSARRAFLWAQQDQQAILTVRALHLASALQTTIFVSRP